MQIFFLNADPKLAAQELCDKHCVKMVLETMQIISTVWYTHSRAQYDIYYGQGHLIRPWARPTHPSIRWVGLSLANYYWTVELLIHLCAEYTFRYGKNHQYERFLEPLVDIMGSPNLPDVGFIPMTEEYQALPPELKTDEAEISYKAYYISEKVRFAKWQKGRSAPDWWINYFNEFPIEAN